MTHSSGERSKADDHPDTFEHANEAHITFSHSQIATGEVKYLTRSLTLLDATIIVFGIIVGSGIFASPGSVLSGVESSISLALIVWLFGGLLSLLGGLCFAELGAAIPTSGGDYVYLTDGLHPLFGFLFVWACFWCIKTGSLSILAIVFADYFGSVIFSFGDEPQLEGEKDYRFKLLAMSAIIILSIVNLFGAKWASRLHNIIALFKFGAIFMVFLFATIGLATSETTDVAKENFTNLIAGNDWTFVNFLTSFGIATVSALWAYDGFSNLNCVAEEVKNPGRNIPLAIIIAVSGVTLVYLLMNTAYLCVLTPEQVTSSNTVAIEMAKTVVGVPGEIIMALLVSFSALGTLNGSILTTARIFYAAARDERFPFYSWVSKISRFEAPYVAVILQMVTALIIVIPGNFDVLVSYFGFAAWVFNGLVVIALIRLRFTQKSLERPFRVRPFPWIPILFLLCTLLIIVSSLVEAPISSGVALVVIVLGIPVYYLFYWRGNYFLKLWKKISGIPSTNASMAYSGSEETPILKYD